VSAVTVTRDRHPLAGHRLAVFGRMRRHGRLELLVVLPDGSKTLLPAAWTDMDAATSSGEEEAATAATLGSLADLLGACALASRLAARAADQEQAARQFPCEEDHRAAHSAQFDAPAGTGATPDRPSAASRTADRSGGDAAGPADRPGGRCDQRDRQRGGER
jgi:hypothetical protein